MTSKPKNEAESADLNTDEISDADAVFMAELEASFALDPIERVSTYQKLAEQLETELNTKTGE